MRASRTCAVGAALLVSACSIEGMTFTPLPEEPDASRTNDCGDGTRQASENCDDTDLGGETCETVGDFTGGALACDENCEFATTACTTTPTVPHLRRPMNGAYVGSTLRAGSMRATFGWEPSTTVGSESVTYDLQYSRDPTFKNGTTTVTVSGTAHQLEADPLVSTTIPFGSRYYWRVRACADAECSEYSSPWWVNLGRTEHDFNGDGYADVVVGAPGARRAYVYFGGAGGSFDATPNGTLVGGTADNYGVGVAAAGDLNADGFGDIVVGADQDDNGGLNAGRAYVYLGGPGLTFDASPDGTLADGNPGDAFGRSVAGAGDLNGDGFADVAVGAYGFLVTGESTVGRAFVYFGNAGGTFENTPDGVLLGNNDHLGVAVDGAGDVDGDGFGDLLVAGYGEFAPPACQCVHIYRGASGATFDVTRDTTLVGESGGIQLDGFGEALAEAGDVNGDGFGDVLVGASTSYAGGLERLGRAYVYFGGDGAFDVAFDGVFTGAANNDLLGGATAGAGDVNGDGYSDVVVGTSGNDAGGANAGRALLFLGSSAASIDATPDGTFTGTASEQLGLAVALAGDTNGDGFADVVVGAPGYSAGTGAAYVYMGGPSAPVDSSADGVLSGAAGEYLGGSVALRHDPLLSPIAVTPVVSR